MFKEDRRMILWIAIVAAWVIIATVVGILGAKERESRFKSLKQRVEALENANQERE